LWQNEKRLILRTYLESNAEAELENSGRQPEADPPQAEKLWRLAKTNFGKPLFFCPSDG
jgi:hypothetical protein